MSSDDRKKAEERAKARQKQKEQERQKSKKDDGKGKADSRPKSSTQIEQEEWNTFVLDGIKSHGAFLAKPILSFSEYLQTPPVHISYIFALFFLSIHLFSPVYLTPHISALITLVIPINHTRMQISLDLKRSSSSGKDSAAVDAPQWLFYWVAYISLDMIRGWVSIYRPGWRGWFEVVRTVGLVTCGGPWFSRPALRPPAKSKELVEAEKREAEEAKKPGKEPSKDDSKDKNDKAKAQEEAKAKKKAEAKAKAEKQSKEKGK